MPTTPAEQNHHYVPQFLLERWKSPDQLTSYFWTSNGKLWTGLYTPAQVCYVKNLYTLRLPGRVNSQVIETDFFGEIDRTSADVVSSLLDDTHSGALLNDQLDHLALFVLSLIARSPESIRKAEAMLGLDSAKALAVEKPFLPEAEIQDRARIAIMEVIANRHSLNTLRSMKCQVLDIGGSANDLLLSDRPVILDGEITDKGCSLLVPLSPKHLLAMWTPDVKFDFRRYEADDVVENLNKDSITRSFEYVYGTGKHHKALVETLLKKPKAFGNAAPSLLR